MSNNSLSDSAENEDNFQVFARIRPPSPREVNIVEGFHSPRPDIKYSSEHFPVYNSIEPPSCLLKTTENFIYFYDPLSSRRDKPFVFDAVFNEKKNNFDVFQNCVKPNLDNLFQGFNTTFFAYGNTGSGKTHTIFGGSKEKGIFIMAFDEILQRIKQIKNKTFLMNFSFLEIYNENVRDLISETQKSLSLIEDPIKGVYVPELKQNAVYTLEQIEQQISIGNQKRALASTFSNQYSSRSHAILQLLIECKGLEDSWNAKLTVVDLAGSEKAFIYVDNKNKGMLEGSNINKSLLALGNCINILSEKNKKGCHVPYRDSKLTRLLKDSLGGNTKTIMIACISPSLSCMEETLNTLNYAKRARNIKKKVFKNIGLKESLDEHEIGKYKEQILVLQQKVNILNTIINQPIICQNCKSPFLKEKNDIQPEIKIIESNNFPTDAEVNENYKTKSQKLNLEKNDILKNIKLLENRLSQINKDNNEMLDKNNNCFDYFKRICKDMMANIEENFEINQSLKELDDLISQNNMNLNILNEKLANIDENLYEIDEVEEEISLIKKNNNENIEIKNKLGAALNINQNQKNILFELLLKVMDNNKATILEKEIALKKAKLETNEISQENNELMKDLHLKDKSLLEKDMAIASLKNQLNELKSQRNFDSSPISNKNQTDFNQKRINSTNIGNKNLLTPPQIENQKFYGTTNYVAFKSPKTDIIKKNKSDCLTKTESNSKDFSKDTDEGQMTIKKIENIQTNAIFNHTNSIISPYKLNFPNETKEFFKSKINKENMFPGALLTKTNSEKLLVAEYLQNHKKNKKMPLITTIELFKHGEEKNEEQEIIKSPRDVFQKSSSESEKIKKRTTSTSKRYDSDPNPTETVVLNEFCLNQEDTQKYNPLDADDEKNKQNSIEFLQDSINCQNENPLISQSLKKNKFSINKNSLSNQLLEEKTKIHQSFEDFRSKFLSQNENTKTNIENSNFNNFKIKNNEKENLAAFYFKNFDSATKNPLESESENDNAENIVGSPVIQKSSRNYYATSKVLPGQYNNREFLKL